MEFIWVWEIVCILFTICLRALMYAGMLRDGVLILSKGLEAEILSKEKYVGETAQSIPTEFSECMILRVIL